MTKKSTGEVTVQLLFVDEGVFHPEEIRVSEASLARYERLIDVLQEDPSVLERVHIDFSRLCSAQIVG